MFRSGGAGIFMPTAGILMSSVGMFKSTDAGMFISTGAGMINEHVYYRKMFIVQVGWRSDDVYCRNVHVCARSGEPGC